MGGRRRAGGGLDYRGASPDRKKVRVLGPGPGIIGGVAPGPREQKKQKRFLDRAPRFTARAAGPGARDARSV